MSKLIIAGNEIIPGTITVTANNSTITPKDDLRVILNISAVGAVTLSDGTDTTQRVEVFNVSSSACSITYKGSGGNVTYSLRNASGMTLLWTGTYWKATIAGLITGTDANGNTINYTSEATIDLHEEPVQYSTTEQDTGKTWIDGKAIYRKSFSSTVTTYNDPGGNKRDFYLNLGALTGYGTIVKGYGYIKFNDGSSAGQGFLIPSTQATNAMGVSTTAFIHNNTTNLVAYVNTYASLNITSITFNVTIEYTKST